MKKLIAFLLVFVMAVSLVACTPAAGNNEGEGKETNGTNAGTNAGTNGGSEAEGGLVLDDKAYGTCPVCKTSVQWIKFDGTEQFPGITEHLHFYLAEDVTYMDNISVNMITTTGGNVCFHFNGHTLTTGARFWVAGEGETDVLNLITENNKGGLVYTGSYGNSPAAVQLNRGSVNIYGGTYTTNFNGVEIRPIFDFSRSAVLKDATIEGNIYLAAKPSNVTLEGSTTIKGILTLDDARPDTTCKFTVASGWSGSANLNVSPNMLNADGSFKEANGVATGDFTGTLTLDGSTQYMHQGGKLVVKK